MKKYPLCFILFVHTMLCIGCDNKQKKEDYVIKTTIQKIDSAKVMIDKLNLKKEEILSWSYNQAFAKLGEPIAKHTFTMANISEFNIELLNFLPADPEIKIRQLTFETDSIMNLTIWYVEKDQKWQPIHFMKWNKNSRF